MPHSKEEALKNVSLERGTKKKGNQTTESKIRPSEHSYYLKHWVFLLLPYGLPIRKMRGLDQDALGKALALGTFEGSVSSPHAEGVCGICRAQPLRTER